MLNQIDINIKITSNPYLIPIDKLFTMASRKNKKRSFLFISKVLGKYTPVNPFTPLLAGRALAARILDEVYGTKTFEAPKIIKSLFTEKINEDSYSKLTKNPLPLPEEAIFIGFAETATALGQSVYNSFTGNHFYIHTTRENIVNFEPIITFEEEHSHATSHKIYSFNNEILEGDSPIILIDDEITTGKTALNIIRAINKTYPRKKYIIASLLDWRNSFDKKIFEETEKELGIKIHNISLLAGEIQANGNSIDSYQEEQPKINSVIHSKNWNKVSINSIEPFVIKASSINTLKYNNDAPYLSLTGRFGLEETQKHAINLLVKKVSNELSGIRTGKTLCLGTGEFMYLPMVISANMGANLSFQSTARSPIHASNTKGYGVNNHFSYESPDDPSIFNYIYNVPIGYYDDVFVFLEREYDEESLKPLYNALEKLEIKNINIITFMKKEDIITMPNPIGTYSSDNVTFLLKNLGELLKESGLEDREEAVQSGRHYSEMLPIEYKPSENYMKLFYKSLNDSAKKIATSVGVVSEIILANRGVDLVLVSLARAGTPIGVLIKQYLNKTYGLNIPHYSISIIRGKGIDENAINYIYQQHPNCEIQFVDGWTGKGAITQVLTKASKDFELKYGVQFSDDLAVLADPGYCVATYGTREDFLIPSACLNSTVTGLVSRTVHREDLIGQKDFHGAKFYDELVAEDVSNVFIETIANEFSSVQEEIKNQYILLEDQERIVTWDGLKALEGIQRTFGIDDINLVKPGVGETTRVLLRRVPWKVLVRKQDDPNLQHILMLARDKGVPVEVYPNMIYSCCGLIKPLDRRDKNEY